VGVSLAHERWSVCFSGTCPRRIFLASGKADTLDGYILINKGHVNRQPLAPVIEIPSHKPSLALCAMKSSAVVTLTSATPDTEPLTGSVDWVELKAAGTSWVLASPLTCVDPHCNRLLGACLVAGNQAPEPAVNPEWFREWCCELAHDIGHASISVMESSLVSRIRRYLPCRSILLAL